ncbi:hypothetical protein Tco_1336020 [Tanacetum coccineum]
MNFHIAYCKLAEHGIKSLIALSFSSYPVLTVRHSAKNRKTFFFSKQTGKGSSVLLLVYMQHKGHWKRAALKYPDRDLQEDGKVEKGCSLTSVFYDRNSIITTTSDSWVMDTGVYSHIAQYCEAGS